MSEDKHIHDAPHLPTEDVRNCPDAKRLPSYRRLERLLAHHERRALRLATVLDGYAAVAKSVKRGEAYVQRARYHRDRADAFRLARRIVDGGMPTDSVATPARLLGCMEALQSELIRASLHVIHANQGEVLVAAALIVKSAEQVLADGDPMTASRSIKDLGPSRRRTVALHRALRRLKDAVASEMAHACESVNSEFLAREVGAFCTRFRGYRDPSANANAIVRAFENRKSNEVKSLIDHWRSIVRKFDDTNRSALMSAGPPSPLTEEIEKYIRHLNQFALRAVLGLNGAKRLGVMKYSDVYRSESSGGSRSRGSRGAAHVRAGKCSLSNMVVREMVERGFLECRSWHRYSNGMWSSRCE